MKKLILTCLIITTTYSSSFSANYHDMGRNAYVYRNFDKAREYFLLDVKQNPNRGDSYYFLGELEKTLKNYDESIKYFQTAVTKNTTRKYLINAYWNIILLFEEKGDFNNLVKYCRELWFRTGDNSAKKKIETIINKLLWTDNDQAIQKYNQGIELSKKGDKAGAMQLYKECLIIDISFLSPRFELGMNAYNSGNETEALIQLNYIGEKIPFYAEVHLILGGINFKNKNYSAATENFSSVINFGFIDKNTEYTALLKRGTSFYHMNNFDEAEKDITSSLDFIKKDSEPLIMLSAIYIKKKNFDGALKILNRAESISNHDPAVLFQTGSIYYYKNDPKFVSYFDRLFDISKSNDDGIKQYLKAFKLLLNNHFENHNYTRSLEISESINKSMSDKDIILISAKSSYHLKLYLKSIESFEKTSLNDNSRLMLATAYAHSGNKNKTIELLKIIINNEPIRNEAMKDSVLKAYIDELGQKQKLEQKEEKDLKQKREIEAKQKLEIEAKQKLEIEAKQKLEIEAKQKLEIEAKQKLEIEAKQKSKQI